MDEVDGADEAAGVGITGWKARAPLPGKLKSRAESPCPVKQARDAGSNGMGFAK